MTAGIAEDTVRVLTHIRVEEPVQREQVAQPVTTNRGEEAPKKQIRRVTRKIYPNDPCPCGSGKKYKNCHGRKLYGGQNS